MGIKESCPKLLVTFFRLTCSVLNQTMAHLNLFHWKVDGLCSKHAFQLSSQPLYCRGWRKSPSPRSSIGIFVRVVRSCTSSTLPRNPNKSAQWLIASALTYIMGQALRPHTDFTCSLNTFRCTIQAAVPTAVPVTAHEMG